MTSCINHRFRDGKDWVRAAFQRQVAVAAFRAEKRCAIVNRTHKKFHAARASTLDRISSAIKPQWNHEIHYRTKHVKPFLNLLQNIP